MPRVLRGIDSADLSTSLFGIKLKTPIIQAPVAAQGLAHEEGEVATAKAMAEVGSIFQLVLTEVHQWKTPQKQHQMHRNFPIIYE